ncbi:MAG: hypothetical protein IKL65_05010 [Bacilli bacterium]|nr:hypothetical protein [Bacilli bacterium]
MKKKIIIPIIVLVILCAGLITLPHIKIYKNNTIKYISYSDDISEYDEITCYDDGISYYKEKDISIIDIDIEKKFMFYFFDIEYVEGNLCDVEFILEESYVKKFIDSAEIIDNEKNIDIASLIKGKTAIIKNKRYFGNDYETYIEYKLEDKYETMYIFYVDDLLVLQVGLSDEGPKFIAYK